jgi:DNA-binding NtrC family response regulator
MSLCSECDGIGVTGLNRDQFPVSALLADLLREAHLDPSPLMQNTRLGQLRMLERALEKIRDEVAALQGDSQVDLTESIRNGATFEDIQNQIVQIALRVHKNNVAAVARSLGVGRATLYRWIDKAKAKT